MQGYVMGYCHNLTEGVEHFFRTLAEFLRGRTKLPFSCNDSKSDALRFGS